MGSPQAPQNAAASGSTASQWGQRGLSAGSRLAVVCVMLINRCLVFLSKSGTTKDYSIADRGCVAAAIENFWPCHQFRLLLESDGRRIVTFHRKHVLRKSVPLL